MNPLYNEILSKAQHIITLINDIESSSKQVVPRKLRTCVKKLIEFSQYTVHKKKVLKDDSDRQNISQAISTIKSLTPIFTKCINEIFIDKQNLKAKIELDRCVAALFQAIRLIIKTFKTKMDALQLLMEGEDTLYFDFQLSRIDDAEDDENKYSVIPMVKKENLRSPSLEECSIDMVNESSELVDSAHNIIRRAQKIFCSGRNKEKLKILRRKLNQAIIEYNASTTNMLEDMKSEAIKHQLMDDARTLIKEINEMKRFLQMLSTNHAATKDFSKTSCSDVVKHISTTDSTISNDHLHSERNNTTVHHSKLSANPINLQRIQAKANQVLSTIHSEDVGEFEKEINSITEYQDSIKKITGDMKKRISTNCDIDDMMDKSSRCTRQIIRHCRDAYIKDAPTQNELESLDILANDWSKNQAVLLDAIWHQLAPWTSFTGHLFPTKVDEVDFKRTSSKLSNTMIEFKEIEKAIRQLMSDYFEVDIVDEKDERKKSHQIKAKNLSIELTEYSNKVLQLAKLHLLGDIDSDEWASLGLWLFRWANGVQQLIYHVSTLSNFNDDNDVGIISMTQFNEKHRKMKVIAEQTIKSCQNSQLKSSLQNTWHNVEEKFKSAQVYNNSRRSEASFRDVHLSLLQIQWKVKAYALSQLIEESTNYISTPINTLVASVAEVNNNMPSFDDYKIIFMKKMERVRIHTCLAVDKSTSRSDVHTAIETLDSLDEITENIYVTCRLLKDRDVTMVIHSSLHLLRLQWLSHSNYMLYLLRQLPEVRYSAISAIMRHFHEIKDVSNPDEFLEVMGEHVPSAILLSQTPSTSSYNVDMTSEYDSMYGTWADYSDGSEMVNDATIEENEDDKFAQAKARYFSNISPQQQDSNIKTDQSVLTKRTKSPKPPVSPKPTKWKSKNIEHTKPFQVLENADNGNLTEPMPKSIAAAAHILHREADKWEDENNSIIKVVKLMANQMFQMAEFSKGRGTLKSKEDLVLTAKAIAANAKNVAQFASIIAEHCSDESCRRDLLHYIELVPTISTQLRIVSSVKSVTTDDETADMMLVANADNLMKAVVGTLKAAESACVQISNNPSINNETLDDSRDLAFQWKRKIRMKRAMDALASPRDELGLRLLKDTTLPSLTDLLLD